MVLQPVYMLAVSQEGSKHQYFRNDPLFKMKGFLDADHVPQDALYMRVLYIGMLFKRLIAGYFQGPDQAVYPVIDAYVFQFVIA
jgi:hypothetical protein